MYIYTCTCTLHNVLTVVHCTYSSLCTVVVITVPIYYYIYMYYVSAQAHVITKPTVLYIVLTSTCTSRTHNCGYK